MIFQDNVIKEYLRNVYFIAGTPCAGKTTVTKALGEKYGVPVYEIDEQFTVHQLLSDKERQPNMNRRFKNADEFFSRSAEEYRDWLYGNSREQLDYALLDLIKLSKDSIVLCDINLDPEDASKITDPGRIAFLIKKPCGLVEEYCDRPDHQDFSEFIHSASDYEKAKSVCNEALYLLNIGPYESIKSSGWFYVERDGSRSADETAALVEKHFGWRLLRDFSVVKVEKGAPLAERLFEFVEGCSWTEVKEHMTGLIRNWNFTDWETMFAAVADGRIIGMASVMKEDYYPLPDVFPWVSSVFVDEEYRGLRVSGRLIDSANRYLRDLGFVKSYIPSDKVGLYERYGYTYVKDITNYGGTVDHLYAKALM